MTEKQKNIIDKLKDYAPLMTFFSIITLGVSGIFWLGSFTKEFKILKEQVLTPLEKEKLLEHESKSDDLRAHLALMEYNEMTQEFLETKDSLFNILIKNDSLSKLNYTTIYQIKQSQEKFFREVKQVMRSLEKPIEQ
jgi:hypothetical protein